MDLLRALSSNEFEAWCAVATRLDHFANRLSQGYPLLRIKPRYTGTPKEVNKIKNWLRPGLPDISEKIPVEVEFELNMDIQVVDDQIEVITKSDVNIKGKVKLNTVVEKLTKSKVPVEISAKSNTEGKITTNVKIAKYAMEFDTSGKAKFSVQTVPGVWVDSEMNATTGMFGGGVSLKGKELAEKLKLKGHTKWASYLENWEVQIQVGVVGTREETILATTSLAPGFFERRSLQELLSPKTLWIDLNLDEQRSLVALGW